MVIGFIHVPRALVISAGARHARAVRSNASSNPAETPAADRRAKSGLRSDARQFEAAGERQRHDGLRRQRDDSGTMDEGRAETATEQPGLSAGRWNAQQDIALGFAIGIARLVITQERGRESRRKNSQYARPGTSCDAMGPPHTRPEGEALGDVVAPEPDHEHTGKRASARPLPHAGPSRCPPRRRQRHDQEIDWWVVNVARGTGSSTHETMKQKQGGKRRPQSRSRAGRCG